VIDPATGAFNGRHGERLMARLMGAARLHGSPFTVILAEIVPTGDDEPIGGDELLKESVRRIRSSARLRDAIVRASANRLLILLEETDVDGAVVLAERIQRVLGENPVRAGADRHVEVRIPAGVVQAAEDEAPDALLERAAVALGQAVENGAGGIHIERGMTELPKD